MGNFIRKHVPLNDKNWFKTGGKALFFCEPKTEEEFSEALLFAKRSKLEIFVLGKGANILISDDGFDGLVIRPKLEKISLYGELICAGAGVNLETLIKTSLDNNLCGLEEFSGIPGSVGGSVFINIHYFEFLLSEFLIKATVINKQSGETRLVDKKWFDFGYNTSKLHEKEFFLINATFKLTKTDPLKTAYNKGRMDEIMRHRSRRYPTKSTCGSFFRNFHKEELPEKMVPYVAYYLDKIGVKGNLSIGKASVSHRHANMLVNNGEATSVDIISLARKMQELVFINFQLIPQPECQLIGFEKNPLHTKKSIFSRQNTHNKFDFSQN